MREFEYSEACVYALGAHIFPHSGNVENAGQALEYLRFLPEAVKYDSRRVELFNARKTDPDLGKAGWELCGFPGPYVPVALTRVSAFCHSQNVLDAFKDAAQNKDIPQETRGFCDIVVKLESNQPVDNLLKDGSFENGNADAWTNGQVTSEKACRGKNSYKLELNAPHVFIGSKNKIPVDSKGGNYLMSAMIYVKQDHPDVEEFVKLCASAQKNGINFDAWATPKTHIKPGEWTRVSLMAAVKPGMDTFSLDYIIFDNFSKGDVAYIDDVIITPLGK
jgi:hypothetical protein